MTTYARELEIPHFRGVFMRDMLPLYPFNIESGIVNFNTSNQAGSHWVCNYRNQIDRIYFYSYGQITPVETQISYKLRMHHLCLFVLKSLAYGEQFQSILNHMQHDGYLQSDWKNTINKERASISQSIATQALSIHYTCNWTRKIIHYWETSHIMLLTLLLYAMTFAIEIVKCQHN